MLVNANESIFSDGTKFHLVAHITGKNGKVDSSHVTAMKFIGKKRLVLKLPIIL